MATIFRTASIWLKIAIGCMGLGLLLFIIGFSTTSWVKSPHYDRSFGLWQFTSCGRSCSTHAYSENQLNDYHRAIQAMECLGLIGFFLATLTLLLYMVMDSCRRRDFLQGATALTFAGLLFAIIGFALFGSSSNTQNYQGYGRDIAWSMGLACAGGAFYGLAGIALVVQLIR